MNETPIKVFVVDDHKLIVDGIVSILSTEEGITVVGTAASGEDAINAVSNLKPDVILMDIVLKKMTGLEACRWIKERDDNVKVLLLSMEVTRDYLKAGIQSGISGYLHKDIDKGTLVKAITTVVNGEHFFAEALTKLVFEDFLQTQKTKTPIELLPNNLTKREYEILASVATGKSNREVADALFISIKTVETHKAHILEKLGLRNNAELVKYAIQNNIIPS